LKRKSDTNTGVYVPFWIIWALLVPIVLLVSVLRFAFSKVLAKRKVGSKESQYPPNKSWTDRHSFYTRYLIRLVKRVISPTSHTEERIRAATIQESTSMRSNYHNTPARKSKLRLSIINKWARLRRKPVAKTHFRIEWTCQCGYHLFADFPNTSRSRLDEYAAILKATPIHTSENTTPQTPPSGIPVPPAVYLQNLNSPDMTNRTIHQLQSSASLDSTLSMAASSGGTFNPSFLELCVNTGAHVKTLGEIDLTIVSTDGAMFRAIKERYLALRGFRSKFWLLKPTAVSFVRVRPKTPSICLRRTNEGAVLT